jgi:transcriptional regulator with XRE-family HTH domain
MTIEVPDLMAIKDRLRELRTAAGLTQQQLAVKAGLSMSAVAHLEGGRIPDPRVSTLLALAKALGVTLDQLAGDEGGGHPPEEEAGDKPRRRQRGGRS